MPLKIACFIILIFLIISGGIYFARSKHVTTSPSGFANITQSIYSNRGIVDRIISIQLSSKNTDSETQEITAEISMPFDYAETLQYKWNLAENVVIAAGDLSGVVDNLKASSPTKIKILVKGFVNNESRFISFEAVGQTTSRRIYGESLLASQAEKSFENIVQNVERIKASRNGKSRE
ncbi:MAG: hypothetical protein H7328_09170 [Bdellovibrio sp.]|nr:hypothetical protein [Bdellovibrio sp.]